MAAQDTDQVPEGVPDADYAEQHQLLDGSQDDDSEAVPPIDLDIEADPADIQEQSMPAPVDDESHR